MLNQYLRIITSWLLQHYLVIFFYVILGKNNKLKNTIIGLAYVYRDTRLVEGKWLLSSEDKSEYWR